MVTAVLYEYVPVLVIVNVRNLYQKFPDFIFMILSQSNFPSSSSSKNIDLRTLFYWNILNLLCSFFLTPR